MIFFNRNGKTNGSLYGYRFFVAKLYKKSLYFLLNWARNELCKTIENIIKIIYNCILVIIGQAGEKMELSKKNIKKILGIITFAIILFAVSQNLTTVFNFLSSVFKILAPVIVGLALAFMLNILMNVLERRVFAFMKKSKKRIVKKFFKPMSLIATLLLTFGFFALLLFIIMPQLKDTIMLLVEKIPVYYTDLINWIESLIVRFGLDVNTEILHNPKFDINNIYTLAQNFFTIESTSDILNTTMGVTSTLVSGVSNLVLGFIIAIYVLAEKDNIGNFTSRFFSAALPENVYSKAKEICSVASNSFANFITGQFTDAVLLSTMCFVGMLIFRLPNAAVVSVIIGITALVPIIGPIVGEIIGCLIIFMESPIKALFFIIFVLILQMIDNNLIYPRIMGKSIGLPGLLVLIAVVIGGNIGGILGVLLGVPTASAVYALIITWIKNKKEREREKETVVIKGNIVESDHEENS